MKKTFKSIRKYFGLVKEGRFLKDKVTIAIYAFNFLLNRLSNHKTHALLFDVTLKNSDGIFFCGKNIFSVWTGSSFYESELRKYFDLEKGTFIDVGANIGKYSILLGKKLKERGTVLAIEPEEKNFNILKKNIKLNGLKNVMPINKGCFSKKDTLDFYLENIGYGKHSLSNKELGDKKIQINVDALSNIVKKNKIKDIKLIKIDVEGAEADVLKGAEKILKKYHPKIIFEAWNEEQLKGVKKELDKMKYKIKRIDPENYLAY
jgi:FkbM family methyltransferase